MTAMLFPVALLFLADGENLRLLTQLFDEHAEAMVLLFLLLGLLGRQMLGPMIYGFLLFFNVAVLVEMFPGGIQTPVSFSTLAAISSRAMGSDTELQLLREALLGYVTACAALMLALMLTVKRADLSFREENRE